LMILYPLVLLGGVGLGLAAKRSTAWLVSGGAVTAAGLLLLVVQLAVGFPIEKSVARSLAQNAFYSPHPDASLASSMMVNVTYTPWLWLSLVAVLAALGCLAAELVCLRVLPAGGRAAACPGLPD